MALASTIATASTRAGEDVERWTEVRELTVNDAQATDHFGESVAIDGNWLIVGALDDDGGDGAVCVFERPEGSGAWVEVAKVVPETRTFELFGETVGLSGDTLVAGAPFHRPNVEGAAYVFERDGNGSWNQVVMLEAPDATEMVWANSVAIDGDVIAIGAPNDDVGVGAV